MSGYSTTVIDHFESPRNAGELDGPDFVGLASLRGRAPYIMIQLRVDHDIVSDARFKTFGCGAAIAAASMLTTMIIGRSLAGCTRITEKQLDNALEGLPAGKRFCVSLALDALRDALAKN